MKITEITENKKKYIDLLLLADEDERMIDRYLTRGRMYVLDDGGVKCECVVTDEGNGVLEIKNIATSPEHQRKGYARALIDFIVNEYENEFSLLPSRKGIELIRFRKIDLFPILHRILLKYLYIPQRIWLVYEKIYSF